MKICFCLLYLVWHLHFTLVLLAMISPCCRTCKWHKAGQRALWFKFLVSSWKFSCLCNCRVTVLYFVCYCCSPSGCTFWGKKPWSRKKKILWQMGTLIGAPLGIALAAGVVLPAMVIGIPVYVGRQVRFYYRLQGRKKSLKSSWSMGQYISVFIFPS